MSDGIIIGIAGKAGSGKDTFTRRLTEAHGFTRVAFADPLKELARKIDPIVQAPGWAPMRLTAAESFFGAEGAKKLPEVRRFYQELGQGVREIIGAETWVDLAFEKVWGIVSSGGNVVITDVRHPNEVAMIQEFHISTVLRIDRPGAGLGGGLGAHPSEQVLNIERVVLNDGSIEDLHVKADLIAESMLAEAVTYA